MAETKAKTTKANEKKETKPKAEKKESKKANKGSTVAKLDLTKVEVTPEKVGELKAEVAQLRMDYITGKQKDVSQLRKARKNVARALTQLNMNKSK